MSLKNFYYKILRKFIKLSEKIMHVEAFVRDDLWRKITDLIGKNFVWFVVTPANYEYCKVYFNLKFTKTEFTEILKKRIQYLKENNEEIQLHLHICNVKEFFDNELQDMLFEEAMEFMKQVEIKPEKIALGWFKYNDYTITLAEKYGLKFIYDFDKNPKKKALNKGSITIKYLHKFWHDYDFA